MSTTASGPGRQASPEHPTLNTGTNWAAWLRAVKLTPSHRGQGTAADPEQAWAAMVHLARRAGFTVQHAECADGQGFTTWRNRVIRIAPHVTGGEAVIALAHQLGHVLLHAHIARLEPSMTVTCRGLRKVEADSVAFLVSTHLRTGTGAVQFPAITSWAGTDPRAYPEATVTQVAQRVVDAAARIVTGLEQVLPQPAALRGEAPTVNTPARTPSNGRGQVSRPQGESAQVSLPVATGTTIPRADLAQIHDDARVFFHDRLHSSWVPGYLSLRGFGPWELYHWQVGYAPAGWSELTDRMRALGYRDEVIEAAGLARRSARGTLIDTFRDRAMLPIRAADGTVTGFIGRAAQDAAMNIPKYLNSPTTSLYDKSQALFGLWEARDTLAAGARPVITEGPLDAIAVSLAGQDSYAGVALCGTALTAKHVAAVGQAANLATTGVLVAFDADQAGRRAAVRAYRLLAPAPAR